MAGELRQLFDAQDPACRELAIAWQKADLVRHKLHETLTV